jgi:RNA polymerase sigma-70 factor (ECF subfamily)
MEQQISESQAPGVALRSPTPASTSDRRLLQAVRRGSAEAAEALVARHWSRAHRIAYGILGDSHAAEDVAQEAMLAALEGIGRFDPYRPFAPWLHRVVSNRALDLLRSRRRRPETAIDVELQADETTDGDGPLREALHALSPEQRAIVVLRHIGGYGPGEIARMLDLPRGTVGSRLRRALDQMRTELEDEDG